MSINKSKNKTKDIFDDDFEVVYQEDHYSNLLRSEIAREKQSSDGYDDDYDDYNNYDDNYDDYDDFDDDYDDFDDYDNYNDYGDKYNDYGYNRNRNKYTGNHRYSTNRQQDRPRNRRRVPDSSSDKTKNRKHRKLPNLASPAARSVKTGGKIVYKLVNILLRCAALILTALIIYTLAVNFWRNHSAYGDVFRAFTEKNYILTAYMAVAGFLLLFELIAFLLILSASMKSDRRGNRYDTGRGLFSFVFIYAGSYLSYLLNSLVPSAPAPLQGVQGALLVYGSMRSALLPLCAAGIISCLIRRFAVR